MGEKEQLDDRFGLIAVKKGFITPKQLIEAFEIQFKENLSNHRHRRIGEIFLEMGVLNASQVNEILWVS